MTSPGTGGGGRVGMASGSGALGRSAAGGGFGRLGVAVRTPRGGGSSGAELKDDIAHAMPVTASTNGMTTTHHALRTGGGFEGMSLSRHSSHSPVLSSGS
jgi:hypothetical protein